MVRGMAAGVVLALAFVLAEGGCAAPKMEYSWQRPQATVLPQGDLAWAPEPFVFEKSGEVRYIDYENGSDDNPGTARTRPGSTIPGTRRRAATPAPGAASPPTSSSRASSTAAA